MKNSSFIKVSMSIIIIISLILTSLTSLTPMGIGYNAKLDKATIADNYDCYYISEISSNVEYHISNEYFAYEGIESEKISESEATIQPLDNPPMDSPWPIYCHDVRHTGRSQYSTIDTWDLKWRFETYGGVLGSSVIDYNGIIYIGADDFYAVHPNGTLKWRYDTPHIIESAAAIDENGIIYVGNVYGDTNLYAFYPNGTLKWKYKKVNNVCGSPVIGNDGTIYFGTEGSSYPNYSGYIIALYPNGTLKWKYKTDHFVHSDPAIGNDGTVYCGCHDGYLYALYPNNGTLKWKYKTEDWIARGPCIADDGTIYFGSWDGHLYACYPNGTMRWKASVGASTTPVIAEDGTIYVGSRKLTAVYPNNGSIKWIFDPGPDRWITGGNPCISAEGTIYFGTDNWDDGTGEIISVNSDGTERWRFRIGPVLSAPAIGRDGTVYVGCSTIDNGYLNAFGWCELDADANGPYYGQINESLQFQGSAKGGYRPHSYHWDFGDGNNSYEEDPPHIYSEPGNYTIVFTVTDNTSNTSSDTSWALIQEINIPPSTPSINGPNHGITGISYDFDFTTVDPDGTDIWYYVEWGDDTNTGWFGPYSSGSEVTKSHTWNNRNTFIIRCKAKDVYNAESDWSEFEITILKTRLSYNPLFIQVLEQFPLLEKLFSFMKQTLGI